MQEDKIQEAKQLLKNDLPEAIKEAKEVKEDKKGEKKIPKAINVCMSGKWAKNLARKGFGFLPGSKEDKKIRQHLCSELTRLV